jgi:hypothetical protein
VNIPPSIHGVCNSGIGRKRTKEKSTSRKKLNDKRTICEPNTLPMKTSLINLRALKNWFHQHKCQFDNLKSSANQLQFQNLQHADHTKYKYKKLNRVICGSCGHKLMFKTKIFQYLFSKKTASALAYLRLDQFNDDTAQLKTDISSSTQNVSCSILVPIKVDRPNITGRATTKRS